MKAMINDDVLNLSEAKLNIMDLGLNRGYGVFDYFRIVDGKFRFLDDHIARFMNSIRFAKLDCSYSEIAIRDKIIELNNINKIHQGYIRVTFTAGDSDDFSKPNGSGNLIIVSGIFQDYPASYFTEGVALISKRYVRGIPEIKTTDYFFVQMHRAELAKAGAIDIIYYQDYISETSKANIFFAKNGVVYTPKSNILQGITRKKILQLRPDIIIKDVAIEMIADCDECFISSSSRALMPIVKIDKTLIGNGTPGPVYREMRQQFLDTYREY